MYVMMLYMLCMLCFYDVIILCVSCILDYSLFLNPCVT